MMWRPCGSSWGSLVGTGSRSSEPSGASWSKQVIEVVSKIKRGLEHELTEYCFPLPDRRHQ
eukprot:9926884-Prorocentrum_lima.AAC.1